MSQISAFVVPPCVEPCLGKQLLVKPLPPRTLEERLVWDAEGGAGESVPKCRIFVVGVKGFLSVGVSEVQ